MSKKSKKDPRNKRDQWQVDELQDRFDELGQRIEQLKRENPEVFAELKELLSEQNSVLDQMTTLCRQLELSTLMVTATPSFKREFDGRKLHKALAGFPELRKRVINIEYRVIAKEYDRAVQKGEIDETVASTAIKSLARSVVVRSAVKAVPIP